MRTKELINKLWFLLLFNIIIISTFVPLPINTINLPSINTGTAYKTPITITNNANTDLTDYQVKIILDSTWDGWDHVANDGSDIYFLDSNNNPLYYWIESFDYSNQEAIIWVKIPNIQASGSTTIYMYYGGDNPYSDYNNPNEVFLLYDDFNGNSLDTSKWKINYPSDGTVSVSNGLLVMKSSNSDTSPTVQSLESFSGNIIVESRGRVEGDQYDWLLYGLFVSDGAKVVNSGSGASGTWYSLAIPSNYYSDISFVIYKCISGSYSELGKKDLGIDKSKFHLYGFAYYNGNLYVFVDGDKVYSISDSDITSGYIAIGTKDNEGYKYVDWIRVRKYVDPEPSISIGSSEPISSSQQQYRTPIVISNNVDQDVTDYSIKIVLNATNWDGWNYVSSDGSDIYFLDSSGNPLYYWVKYFNKAEPNYNGLNYITVGIKPSSYGGSPVEVWVYADGTWYKGTNFRVEDNIPKADFSLLDIGGKTITRVALRHSSATWSDPTNVWIWDSDGNQLYHTTANRHTWDQSFPNYFEYVNINYQAPEPEIIGYGKAIIWVKIPNIQASGSTTIYMYYGGDNPYSSYNDPNKVFLFYDDFKGSTLDTNKWVVYNSGGTYEMTGDEVYLKPVLNSDNAVALRSAVSFTHDIEIMAKILPETDTYYDVGIITNANVLTDKWHGFETDNIGYWLASQKGSSAGTTYYLLYRRDQGSSTKITNTDSFTSPNEIIYIFRYLDDGKLIGIGKKPDGKTLFSIQTTDTTYLDDQKYLVIWQGAYSGGMGGYSKWDWVCVRKYVEPEPSVSIGSSEVVSYGVTIESVSPESVVAGTGDSVSFTVTLNNTLSQDANVMVKLIDHNDVVRDEVNVTVPANSLYNVSVSVIFTVNDLGEHVWNINVYNATNNNFLDQVSVTVKVFNRTIIIDSVSPQEITAGTTDLVSFTVTLNSTMLQDTNIDVKLFDDYGNIRDEVISTVPANSLHDVILSTTLTLNDLGDHVWTIKVYKEGDGLFDMVNVTVHVFNRTIDIISLYPDSIASEPNETVSLLVTIKSTLKTSETVNVSLIDHNNVTRSSSVVSINPNESLNITFTVIFGESDRGNHVWKIIVANSTDIYDTATIPVGIHINVSYSFNYTIHLGYKIGANASYPVNDVHDTYYFGGRACLDIYTNSTGTWSPSFTICTSTIYQVKFKFIYRVDENVTLDFPDDYIDVYIKTDSGEYEKYLSIYIPNGNQSIILPSGYTYKLQIPGSGQTVYGLYFYLETWYIDGIQESTYFIVDSDKTIEIHYFITDDPNYKGRTNIEISASAPADSVSLFKYYGEIWGGDEFYYGRKVINGLINIIKKESITSNVVPLGTSLSSIVAQVGMKFTLQEEYDLPSDGVGVILNGYYSRGVGVFVNGTDIFVAETQYNKSSGKIIINDEDILWRDTVYLQGHLNIRYYVKLGYVNGFLYVLVNVYDLDRHIDTWYHAVLNYTIPGITHITFYNVPYQSNTGSTIEFYDDLIIMRGDYLRVTVDLVPTFYIKINGTDRLNRSVTITCSNNGPGDVDPDQYLVMIADLPVIFPINGTLEVLLYQQSQYPAGKETYDVIYPYGKIIVPKIETIQPYADPVRNTVGGILTMGLLLGVAIAMARTTVPTKHAILIASSILTFIGLILENTGIVGVSITAFLVTAVYSIKQRWEG